MNTNKKQTPSSCLSSPPSLLWGQEEATLFKSPAQLSFLAVGYPVGYPAGYPDGSANDQRTRHE